MQTRNLCKILPNNYCNVRCSHKYYVRQTLPPYFYQSIQLPLYLSPINLELLLHGKIIDVKLSELVCYGSQDMMSPKVTLKEQTPNSVVSRCTMRIGFQ